MTPCFVLQMIILSFFIYLFIILINVPFRFVPFQGLYLIDSVDATNIKDFAVFKKDHIRDSLNIFVVEENNQSKMYRLMTKDYVPKFNMTYGRLNYN